MSWKSAFLLNLCSADMRLALAWHLTHCISHHSLAFSVQVLSDFCPTVYQMLPVTKFFLHSTEAVQAAAINDIVQETTSLVGVGTVSSTCDPSSVNLGTCRESLKFHLALEFHLGSLSCYSVFLWTSKIRFGVHYQSNPQVSSCPTLKGPMPLLQKRYQG